VSPSPPSSMLFVMAFSCRKRLLREIGNLLPNNRRQRRTCYALCHILYPVSAAHTSIFRMDSNSTSYRYRLKVLGPESGEEELVKAVAAAQAKLRRG